MIDRLISVSFALLLFVTAPASAPVRQASESQGNSGRSLTQADKDAVLQAIIDEIYVNDLQGYGWDVGSPVSDSEYQLTAYVQPNLNKDNAAWVIYKLMPYGEVYRLFSIRPDGLAILYGRLQDRFPPTHPSYLTVYMDDDQLWQMKKDWGKTNFTVEVNPSAKRIADARARERKRKS